MQNMTADQTIQAIKDDLTREIERLQRSVERKRDNIVHSASDKRNFEWSGMNAIGIMNMAREMAEELNIAQALARQLNAMNEITKLTTSV